MTCGAYLGNLGLLEQQGGRAQVTEEFVVPRRRGACLCSERQYQKDLVTFFRIQERSRVSCLHWIEVINQDRKPGKVAWFYRESHTLCIRCPELEVFCLSRQKYLADRQSGNKLKPRL